MKNTVKEEQIVNVFITHKHETGAIYIDKCKELLDKCIEIAGQLPGSCDSYRMIYDSAVIEAGDAYSKLNDFYDITDVDILILSEGVKESPWIKQEIEAMQARGVTVLPILFEGDIDSVKPEYVDVGMIDLREGREPDETVLQQIAGKLKTRDKKKKREAAVRKAFSSSEKSKDGYKIKNYLVQIGGKIVKAAGAGAFSAARSIFKAIFIALIVIAILALLGITLTQEEALKMLRDFLF